jgi:hypothetical protein
MFAKISRLNLMPVSSILSRTGEMKQMKARGTISLKSGKLVLLPA